ncbi:MAG TPA: hypothetical protein VNJ08_13945 [Bacteriovoracaceae bacterium]|nr:hypothetical protein [Bacteriovoracaceae bacterium]
MKATFFALLLVISCDRKAQITKDSFAVKVSGIEMDLSQVNEVVWWIGAKKKEEKVTQSVTFLVSMPKLKEEDLEYLMKEKRIDSWLVRVIQVKGSKSQDLGSLITPFVPAQHGRSSSTAASAHAAVKIFYAAAYASERMRAFKCPAFSHDKRITSMSVKGEDKPIDLTIGAAISYREKAQQVQLSPSAFNGGHSLQGEFHLAIAAYDSKRQVLLGDFIRLPRYLEIEREESVYVASCQGVHPETD